MTAPAILPPARPEWTRAEVEKLIAAHGLNERVILVGRRGYYRDSMGVKGKNDRGIYDDAIALLSPTAFVTFNANCDPSVQRAGIATLAAGVYFYQIGTHNLTKEAARRYKALVQASGVNLVRDGGAVEKNVWRGINIHKGSVRSTSSEGCQTIPPEQWPGFIGLVEGELARHGQKTVPYVLTVREDA